MQTLNRPRLRERRIPQILRRKLCAMTRRISLFNLAVQRVLWRKLEVCKAAFPPSSDERRRRAFRKYLLYFISSMRPGVLRRFCCGGTA